ncbi:MAG: hypothetical protein IJ828_10240 [Treponema sp.]|nr:hypothetical protein [Treponema sp.]
MPIKKIIDPHKIVPPRIKELQEKINDKDYVDNAVERIASVISRHITENQSFADKTYVLR